MDNRIDAIYGRQSIDKKDSISIESQFEFCRYELKGGEGREYKDKGYSGKNIERPDFQRLLQDIKLGLIKRVIVYKLDRISRSIVDFAKLMELFKYYLIVGGMPAAVARFAQTRDIAQVQSVQKDILKLYRADIVKYARNKAHVGAIFDAIPAELSKKNKRFKLSDLAKSARMERYASDFMWVADAGVGLTCYNVKAPELPLSLNTQHNLFKLFLCDVGLLSAQTSGDARFDLLQGNLAVSWGSMLENAIAQELTAHGFDLRYFDKAKYGEVDFVIEKGSKALPIEAKSGKDYEKHKALDNVMAVREWGIDSAIVFCRGNVREEGKVLYLPWYAVMFIEKERGPQKIDLAEFLG